MGYRSKNLGSSRRAATTAKVNTQDKLFAARNSLRTFKEEDKELTELTKKLDENTEGSMFLTRYLKSSKKIKKLAKLNMMNGKINLIQLSKEINMKMFSFQNLTTGGRITLKLRLMVKNSLGVIVHLRIMILRG